MSFTKEDTKKIAKLARIRLSDADTEHFSKELSSILHWIEMLSEVNTKGIPEMTSVEDMELPLREDHVTDGNIREDILKNAPNASYGCFIVPKVVE